MAETNTPIKTGGLMNPKKRCVLCQKRRAITTAFKLHVCFPCSLKLALTEANEAEKEFEKVAKLCPKCGAPTKILGVDVNGGGEDVIVHFACANENCEDYLGG